MVFVREIQETSTEHNISPAGTNYDDSDFTDASDDDVPRNNQLSQFKINYDSDSDQLSTTSIENETIMDRIRALKYIIPYTARKNFYFLFVRSRTIFTNVVHFSKKFAWVSITSIFLLGFPLYYEYQKEQQLKFSDLNMNFSPTATN